MKASFEEILNTVAREAINLAKKDESDKPATEFIGDAIQNTKFLNNPVTCATIISESPTRNALDSINTPDSSGEVPRDRAMRSADKALGLIAFWALLGPVTEQLFLTKTREETS